MLDRGLIVATMGTLLSLRNDDYMALGAYPDMVSVYSYRGREVFSVVGFAEGERESLFGGFEEKGIWLFKCWPWTLVNSRYTVLIRSRGDGK